MAEDRADYQAVTPLKLKDTARLPNIPEPSEEVRARESKRKGERLAHEEMELIEVAEGGNGSTKKDHVVCKLGSLLKRVCWEWDEYDDIQRRVTAKALMNDEENPLLLAIKVTEKLHERAGKNEPNEDDFIDLANSVEEFTLRFLDPLKHEKPWREAFALNPETDILLDVAIKLKQKKFFDHPIIIGIMNERWHGNRRVSFVSGNLWWLFLNIWCLFDIVLFPLSFFIFFALGCIATRVRCLRSIFQRRLFYLGDEEFKSTSLCKRYSQVFSLPYFIFVRDTLSYLALLGLHLAICVEPSQLQFSSLEWAILVFLFGRLLMEIKQLTHLTRAGDKKGKTKLLRNYFRDRWNFFDLATLIIFFCAIFPLRIFIWVESETVTRNRFLEIASVLYGFNTMLLTFRVIGSILEAFEGVGTIQIALFFIIKDAVVVVLHFCAITLAFSSTITKLFVAETSMTGEDTAKYSWWKILSHLGLSLLELSDGLDFFKSADKFLESLVHILYSLYLVMALILLINMLIALLSNTYQRVQDNSRNEWAFQKAVTIQTYSNYDPIPVPLNIISTLVMCCGFQKKKATDKAEIKRKHHIWLNVVVSNLKHKYRLKYGDSFPRSYKLDQVLDETENTESMVNQLLYKTFTNQQGCDKAILPTGPQAWETSRHILVEGFLVMATNNGSARYRTAFSRRFPHFEVMILESGVTKWLAVGVVSEDYTYWLPGRAQESLGYHTGEKTIWSTDAEGSLSKKTTKGPSACRRGVVVRCTVLFEDKQKRNGKDQVPVVFTVNGSRIAPEGDPTYIECSPDTPLYPQIGFYYENSVLAKMCPREDEDYQDIQMQELKSDLTEVKSELVGVRKNLIFTKEGVMRHEEKSDLVDVCEKLVLQEMKLELAGVKSELSEVKRNLDALLARLSEKGVSSE